MLPVGRTFPCGCELVWDAETEWMTANPCSEGHRVLLEVMLPVED